MPKGEAGYGLHTAYHEVEMRRPVYRLRHLQAFLDRQPDPTSTLGATVVSFIIAASASIVALSIAAAMASVIGVMVMGAILLIAYMVLSTRFARAGAPAIASWSPEANTALTEVRSFYADSSLEERMDPEVGDHLDLCCATFLQARALLGEENWQNVEGPRLDAKESANAALSALMDDAFVVSLAGIRGKGHRRDVFAKRMGKDNVKSPILASLAKIHGQLDELKGEIASATTRRPHSGDSVRDAISRIAEIRKAEEELRDSIHS